MRILLLALFVLSTNNIFGQSIDGSIIKCMYELKYTKDTLTKQMNEDLLILQVGRILSKSYSFYSNQVDSIFGLPNKDEVLRRAINKAFETNTEHPHKRMKTYVYKNYPVGKITVTDGLSMQDYIYEDELNAQDWEILDSTRMVLDNLCQLAKCTFRGRQYNFVIIGLEKKEEPIVFSKTYIGNKKFEKTNRLEFLKAKKSYLMNMGGYIEMETGIDLGGNSSQKIMRYDLIERDY